MKILGAGGVGAVLETYDPLFAVKIVVRSTDIDGAKFFWSSCKSIHAWVARIRFVSGCVKIPFAMRYWIHRDDAIDKHNTTRSLKTQIPQSAPLRDFDTENILTPALSEIVPSDYILCSKRQLESIYKNDQLGKVEKVRLLVTYPIQIKKESVADYIAAGRKFSEEEIYDALYQILYAVNIIHQGGACRDIKPQNILFNTVDTKKQFFLTDFDAFDSPEHTSYAATKRFLPPGKVCEELKKKFSLADFSKMLDYFALAKTLLCMINGTTEPNPMSAYKLPVEARALYEISSFYPDKIKCILSELEKKRNYCPLQQSYSPCNMQDIDFYKMDECSLGSVGTFREQISFFPCFDPLLKVKGCIWHVPEELSDIVLLPLCFDDEHTYFHAPDDVSTGERPLNFGDYTPKTLSNASLSPEEKDILLSYGRKLNKYFEVTGHKSAYLPQEDHIVWCDGEIKILWGMGMDSTQDTPVNYEEYFRYLLLGGELSYGCWRALLPHEFSVRSNGTPEYWQRIFDEVIEEYSQYNCLAKSMRKDYSWLYQISEFKEFVISKSDALSLDNWLCFLPEIPGLENHLTDHACRMLLPNAASRESCRYIIKFPVFQDFVIKHVKELTANEWLCLLPEIPALENKLTIKVCRQLLADFSLNLKHSWIFGSKIFRKKIKHEVLNFNSDHWLEVRKYTDEFDDRIIDADTIFAIYKKSPKKQKEKLLQNPEWRNLLQDMITSDPHEHLRKFFYGKQYDEEIFLQFYPEQTHAGLTGRMWGKIIAVNPALISFMPERIFPFLNRTAWVRILGMYPELSEKCNKLESFATSEWESILVQQPDLKRLLPDSVDFKQFKKKKLKKNQFF